MNSPTIIVYIKVNNITGSNEKDIKLINHSSFLYKEKNHVFKYSNFHKLKQCGIVFFCNETIKTTGNGTLQ